MGGKRRGADLCEVDPGGGRLHCGGAIGMNPLRPYAAVAGWLKLAKTSLASVLILSLLLVMQAGTIGAPARMQTGGMCAGMSCEHGCCGNPACCHVVEQGKTHPPTVDSKRMALDEVSAPEPRVLALLAVPEARVYAVIKRDGRCAPCRVPPLVASGVWLI